MNWEMITAIGTCISALLFSGALWFAYVQTSGLEKNRKFQSALNVFERLQTPELVIARRYIYESLPESIEGMSINQLIAHIQKAEIAIFAFDHVGYLIKSKYIDEEPMMENYWDSIWKCWKKSKDLVNWARHQRGQKDYFSNFEYLFNLAENYRVQQEYEEPKIYAISRIIT